MAAKKKAESGIQTWKKKRWLPIISEKVCENNMLGETPVEETEKIIGRTIDVNMFTITGDMKKQHMTITYKIHTFRDNKFYAIPIGYSISSSYMKRAVRKGRNRIDDSFAVKTRDNKIVRIKVLMVTRAMTNRSSKCLLKKFMQCESIDIAKRLDFYQLMNEIVGRRFLYKINGLLNKVYPLKQLEIKMLVIDDKINPDTFEEPPLKNVRRIIERFKRVPEIRKERPRQESAPQTSQADEVNEPAAGKKEPETSNPQ